MQKKTYYIVDSAALPEVFGKVIEAKRLIDSKEASSASEAIKIAGLSRSAYYKYKDKVFICKDNNTNKLDIQAILQDKAGVFSSLSSALFQKGANIITMTQTEPKNGVASVYITIDIENLQCTIKELIDLSSQIDGVITIKSV